MSLPDIVTPILPPAGLKQVSDAELARYARLIYERTGIRVSPQKKMLLSNRLRRRLRDTGIGDFETYYRHLNGLQPEHPEWDAFLQEITTHETYLFRDESQWDWFRKDYVPACAALAASGKSPRSLRVWSAACSTGDEAYTVACCVAGTLSNLQAWTIQILGTDIGVGAVEQARDAVFGDRAMRLVPKEYHRFFAKAPDGPTWRAKPILSSLVQFRQHNLMSPLREKPFDLVFLKNVLIYFDADSKKKVFENVRAALRPGGLLVAGAAEGVGDLVKDFTRIQPWLYRSPGDNRR
jgi:chemotaxis protein methyltransferase CheR